MSLYAMVPGGPPGAGRTPGTHAVAKAAQWVFLTIVAAAVMLGLLLSGPRAMAENQVALNEKVKHSVVEVWTTWTGYVQFPAQYMTSGNAKWYKTVAATSCTGFVVDSSGFIATAGHCVDNGSEDTKAMVRQQLIDDLVQNGELRAADEDKWVQTANTEQWLVEGYDRGSPIERKVEVLQPDGPGRVIDQWTTVQVVQYQPTAQGDNALLQVVESKPLEPLVIADKIPASGETLTAVGFPGNVGRITDRSRLPQPSFTSGTVSGEQVLANGLPVTEVSVNFVHGMSGGPTVDSDGEVVGVISRGFLTQGNNFITNAPALRTFLLQNGVHLAQRPAPVKPFPWIWVIVGAAAIALLVSALVVSLVLRRRKKRRSISQQQAHVSASASGQPYPPQAGNGSPQHPVGSPEPVAAAHAQSPAGISQPPRDRQSDVAAAKAEALASIAPEVMTPTPNGTAK